MTATAFANLSNNVADLVARTAPHVVEVESHRSLSSGFVWRGGFVVTADETLAEEGAVRIETADGTVLEAEVVGRDAATDIALLRVAGLTTAPAVFDTRLVRPGALILIVSAADSAPLVAHAIVAAVGLAWQSMRGGTIDARVELDLRLRRRAEGGLALGGNGEAFGMAVRGPRGRTLVIPAATIERIAGALAANGRVPVAYLGAGLRDVVVGDDLGRGAMVMSVDPNGPATTAGINQGDIVLSWNGVRQRHMGMLLQTLRATCVGTAVTLGVRRAGVTRDVIVTIGDRPER